MYQGIILHHLNIIEAFQKEHERACKLFSRFTAFGLSEALFDLHDGKYISWYFYKAMIRAMDNNLEQLQKLDLDDQRVITIHLCSSSLKFWSKKYPKAPISLKSTIDRLERLI